MSGYSETARGRSQPTAVNGIMDRIIGSLGLSRRYYGWLIVSRWPEIVGEHYARNSRAIQFHDGVLWIAVEDAGWRQQMSLDTEKILGIIHGYPHGQVVKNLRLVRGEKGTRRNGD